MRLIKFFRQLDTLKLVSFISVLFLFEIGYSSFLHTLLKIKYQELEQLTTIQQDMDKRLNSYVDQCQITQMIGQYNPDLRKEESGKIAALIVKQASILDFDPLFLASIMIIESHCKPNIRSSRGAVGLMQIKLSTARYVADLHNYQIEPNLSDLTDVEHNINLSTLYLKHLVDKYDGDVAKSLIAYNIGETSLSRLIRTNTPLPTRYLNKINRHYKKMKPNAEISTLN